MNKILRIIDANFNRVREGIRVIEDGIRFYFENEEIYRKIKDFRHDFSKIVVECFGFEEMRKTREAEKDIGKKFDKIKRETIKSTIEKNFQRVEEGIRTIEEYSKILKPSFSISFHNLRFKFYEIEKKVTQIISKKKLCPPLFYVILNLEDGKENFSFYEKVINGKPDIIQLRYKGKNDKFFLSIARKLRKMINDDIIFLINDRVDICILSEADGVHLGKEDLSPEDARKLIPDKIIGVSTSGKGLKRIKEVDYIAVGSIFPSPTKPEKKPIGSDILTVIKKEITIPLIAIGGINLCNVEEVIEKGADGVAVISAVENSPDPEKSVKKFKEKVKKAWKKTIKTEKKNRNQKD